MRYLFTVLLWFSLCLSHDILYSLERDGAVVIRVYFADGTEVAHAPYEVYAPSDQRIPWQKGRTDRMGYLSFYPTQEGRWRVKVMEEGGHGLDFTVDMAELRRSAGTKKPSDYPTHIRLLTYSGLFFPSMLLLYLVSKALRRYRL